jgi:hypothetical protein
MVRSADVKIRRKNTQPPNHLRSGQVPVLNAMGLVRRRAETSLSVRFILGIISIKPDHFAIALESEHVGCYAIEEPSVMAYDYGAAGKIL